MIPYKQYIFISFKIEMHLKKIVWFTFLLMNITNIVQLGRPPLPPTKKDKTSRQALTITQTNLNKPVGYECKEPFPYLCFKQPEQQAATKNPTLSNQNHDFNEVLPTAFQFNSNFENTPPRNFLKPIRHIIDNKTSLSPLLNTVDLNSPVYSNCAYVQPYNLNDSPKCQRMPWQRTITAL